MHKTIPFSSVYDAELDAIRKRRRSRERSGVTSPSEQSPPNGNGATARGSDDETTDGTRKPVDKDLVGLALSGGGVRSASFSLGLVQALDRHGVFSQIDYLSTVSGGGYLGGYLSSLSLDAQTHHSTDPPTRDSSSNGSVTKILTETAVPADDTSTRSASLETDVEAVTPLTPPERGPLPMRVRELIYSGDFLQLPLTFFNGYFIGFALISIFWISGVLTLASGLAWLLRNLYVTDIRYFLRALGFGDDITRACFPGFLLSIIWLVAWLLSYWRDRTAATGKAARFVFGFLITWALLAVALIVSTGSISAGTFSDIIGITIRTDTIDKIAEYLKIWIVVPIVLFLLPYFRPDQLLRSGTSTGAKWWERAIFKLAGVAMLIGVPLLIFGFFARENVSGWHDERSGLLYYSDVDWDKYWKRLKSQDSKKSQDSNDSPDSKKSQESLDDYLWNLRRKTTRLSQLAQIVDQRQLGQMITKLSLTTDQDLGSVIDKIQEELPPLTREPDEVREELKTLHELLKDESARTLFKTVEQHNRSLLKLVVEIYAQSPERLAVMARRLSESDELNSESKVVDWDPLVAELEKMSNFIVRRYQLRQPVILGRLLELSPDQLDTVARKFPKLDKLVTELQLRGLSGNLLNVVENHFDFQRGDKLPSCKDLLIKIDTIQDEATTKTKNLDFYQRWLLLGGYLLTSLDGERPPERTMFYDQLYKSGRDTHYLKLAAMANANEALLSPKFYGKFTSKKDGTDAEIESQKTIAQDLENDNDDPNQLIHITNANRKLLTAYYGEKVVRPKTGVNSMVSVTVVTDKDQTARLTVFWWSAGIFLIAGFAVHLNVSSLQGFYRNQLARTWVAEFGGFRQPIPLTCLDTTSHGYPYHLISATANYVRHQDRAQGSTGPFLFSNLYCGTDRTGYQTTTKFCGGTYDLASAIALSGAAVSPLQTNNLLLQILLSVLNFRLGQWLPNPGHKPWHPKRLSSALTRWPSPFLVIASLMRRSEDRGYCLITDGGHYENLGIGPLLDRRCRVIIAADVGHDPKYEFRDFVLLLRRQRVDNGVQIRAVDGGVLNFDDLLPSKENAQGKKARLSKSHYVVARIEYPASSNLESRGPSHGYLIYLKPTFTENVQLDVETQRRLNADFPHDSTADQFYPPEKFEAYRQLGFDIGEAMVKDCFPKGTGVSVWKPLSTQSIFAKLSSFAKQKTEVETAVQEQNSKSKIDAALERLQHADGTQRKLAALSLGDTLLEDLSTEDHKRVADALVIVLQDNNEDASVRMMVAQMLKLHPDYSTKVPPAAVRCLSDESWEIRWAALDLLDDMRLSKSALAAVRKLAKEDPNQRIRSDAKDILRRQQDLKKSDRPD